MCDQPGDVIDELAACGRVPQALAVIHRDFHCLGTEFLELLKGFLVAAERPYRLTQLTQKPYELRAEKAGCAGDADHAGASFGFQRNQASATGASRSETISFETHQVQ